MKIASFKDIADNSFVISIDKERLDKFYSVFSAAGWKENLPEHVNGVLLKDSLNSHGCTLAHLKVIELAKERSLPFCVIFEDDAYPRYNFVDKVFQAFKDIPDNANALLLGYLGSYLKHHISQNNLCVSLINNSKYIGGHAYAVFNRAYDDIIDMLKSGRVADATLSLIDRAYFVDNTIFIQHILKPSMTVRHGSGYVAIGPITNPNPPEGFPRYEDLINTNNTENINKEKKDEIL